jgi:hypothetical protein
MGLRNNPLLADLSHALTIIFALIAKVYGALICSQCSSGSWLVPICSG